jgi:RNA polymerase sigma-70 factor (ECF subfamily)
MSRPVTSSDWVNRLSSDDPASRESAISELRQILVRALGRTLTERYGSELPIEDIVQDSLVKILDSLDKFAGRSQFVTWAISLATRVGLTELRRSRYRDVSLDAAAGDTLRVALTDKSETVAANSDRQHILMTLNDLIEAELTDRQRVAILALLDGLPVEEIATRVGSKRNAVYKLVHDARMKLRIGLERAGIMADDIIAVIG